MRLGVRFGARCCFYNYANIERRYPWPFRMFERYSFRHATHALAANREAAQIIRRHGYHGPMTIIPQFGVDPGLFPPTTRPARTAADAPLTIGYIGRLVPEKGVLDLIEALALLPAHVCLKIIGDGVQRNALLARIAALGLSSRVELTPWVQDVPAALRELDVLALPSHTTANWKEQFGRILVEAMSSAIPVVGSSSGEIPHVVGNAGLIVPEGNLGALAEALGRLIANPALCTELGQRGRARILAEYTQAAIAQRYYTIYQQMLAAAPLMALPTSQEIGD
jgi:glycosyltransferase involved in cell wall biosynthesis